MTWHENNQKGYNDRKNGVNNKGSISVSQYSLNNEFIKEYYSQMHASRETGIGNDGISLCCSGKRKSAGGYIWKIKSREP